MAEQKTFRSAFSGFNREDVVHYIEYLGAKHRAEINQLNSEAAFLREKLAQYQNVPADNGELELLRSQVEALTREKEELTAQRDAAVAAAAQAESRLSAKPSHSDAELEAYRRAERTERLAKERAQQLYHQANGAIADATVKVDAAAEQISSLTEQCISQLQMLQAAVAGSKEALADAAATMYTIRPEGGEI